jgi:hypothetical protein
VCTASGRTTLGASCANGWAPRSDARFLPWTEGEDASTARRQTIPRDQCTSVRIAQVLPSDRLALVSCEAGGFSGSTYVGIDQLACSPTSIANGPHRETATDPPHTGLTCFNPDSHPLDAASRRLLGQELPDISAAQSAAIVREAQEMAQRTKLQTDLDMIRLSDEYTDGFSDPPTDSDYAGFYDKFVEGLARIERMHARVTAPQRFGPACDKGGSSDDAVRGQRTCRLIAVARENGNAIRDRILAADPPVQLMSDTSDTAAGARHGRALLSELASHNNCREESATFSGLGVRMVLFQALPPARQRQLVNSGAVGFARVSTEAGLQSVTAPNPFYELHNGYVFGGARLATAGGGHDCSTFITAVANGGNAIDAPSRATSPGRSRSRPSRAAGRAWPAVSAWSTCARTRSRCRPTSWSRATTPSAAPSTW